MKKFVGCWGSFDYIIHEGHIMFFEFARSYGDKLIVFVVNDNVIIENKKRQPVNSQLSRVINVSNCNLVDYSMGLYTSVIEENIKQVLDAPIDIFVFGSDQNTIADQIMKQELKKHNIPFVVCDLPKITSTTEILKKRK